MCSEIRGEFVSIDNGNRAKLSIALQLIDGATEGPPGGPGPVFPAGDLPGLADNDARGLGRLFPRPGIGG
jgi:hypothetical protein